MTTGDLSLKVIHLTAEHMGAGPVYPLCQICAVPDLAEWDEREERWICYRCQERPHRLRDLERILPHR